MSDRKHSKDSKDSKTSESTDDSGVAWDINEDADKSAEESDETLQSRSGDDYEGEALQINDNTRKD